MTKDEVIRDLRKKIIELMLDKGVIMEKKWFLSKSIWGSVLVALVVVLRLAGKVVEADQIESESVAISEWIVSGIVLVFDGLAFYGRIKADGKIVI